MTLDTYGNVIAGTPSVGERKAQGPVDMAGFALRNAGSIGFGDSLRVEAVPGGILVVERHSSLVLDVDGGATIEEIRAERRAVGLLLLVNDNAAPVTLRQSDHLRLQLGADLVLQRGMASFLVQFEQGRWQEISRDVPANIEALLTDAAASREEAQAAAAAAETSALSALDRFTNAVVAQLAAEASALSAGAASIAAQAFAVAARAPFPTLAALFADTTMGFAPGSGLVVAPGDVVQAAGHRFLVGLAIAADWHRQNANGVPLYLLSQADGVYAADGLGLNGTGAADDYPILHRLLTYKAGTELWGPSVYFSDGRIHQINTTINLKRPTRLFGSGSGLPGSKPATLKFPVDVAGFIVNRGDTYGDRFRDPLATNPPEPATGADGSIIEGLVIEGVRGTDRTKAGIWLRGRAIVRHNIIRTFSGDGFKVIASAASSDPAIKGNANGWIAEANRIEDCGRHGVYIDGADTNAGSSRDWNIKGCARCGILDSTFLNNAHYSPQVANCGISGVGGNAVGQTGHVRYGGIPYCAYMNPLGGSPVSEELLVSTVPGTNPAVWTPTGAISGGAPSLSGTSEWLPDQPVGTYFFARPYVVDNVNAAVNFYSAYGEGGMPPGHLAQRCAAYGGLNTGWTGAGAVHTGSSTKVGTISCETLTVGRGLAAGARTFVAEFANTASFSSNRGSGIALTAGSNDAVLRRGLGMLWATMPSSSPTTKSTVGISVHDGTAGAYQDMLLLRGPTNDIVPAADNTYDLGDPAFRLAVVHAATGTISTSDERAKQDLRDLDDAERAVAVRLKGLLRAYRFKDAVTAKGEAARIHFGAVAQEVIAAFAAEGLDATRYALLCHDEWDAEDEVRDQETGNVVQAAQPAGDRYGIRYEEMLAFMMAAL